MKHTQGRVVESTGSRGPTRDGETGGDGAGATSPHRHKAGGGGGAADGALDGGALVVVEEGSGWRPRVPTVTWDRARALWASATQGAEDLIELGRVLEGLREEFYAPGKNSPTTWGNQASSARGGGLVKGLAGWEKTVETELGISQQTARRLIEKSRELIRIKAIAEGESVEFVDSKGVTRILEAGEEAVALARDAMPQVVAGLLNPSRAWAGICGEASRRDMGRHRAAVDYAGVIRRALTSLRVGLGAWASLGPEERAELEVLWLEVRDQLPETWGAGLMERFERRTGGRR